MADIKRDMRVAGYAIPKELGKGAKKGAQETKELLNKNRKSMTQLKNNTEEKAKAAAGELPDALDAVKPEVAASTAALASAVQGRIEAMNGTAWGSSLGNEIATGLRNSQAAVASAATSLAGTVHSILGFSSPPKKGPLASIRSWGPHMVDTLARGQEGSVGRARKGAMAWAKAATPGLSGPAHPRNRGEAFQVPGRTPSRGGGEKHYHVGTLIASNGGIDQLERRMGGRRRIRKRARRNTHSPTAQDR
jgi:hypothetical protein